LLEDFKKGDAIRIKDGPFQGRDGVVDEVFPDDGRVRVIVTIYGRPTPIELENWLIELA
jgi:transcriptional antiterminator NusG